MSLEALVGVWEGGGGGRGFVVVEVGRGECEGWGQLCGREEDGEPLRTDMRGV